MKKRLIFLGLMIVLPLLAHAADTTQSTNFVALTKLPGLSSITPTSNSFIAFFNNLYKVAIGVAAAIAFFQIIRAGIELMTAGDNTERVSHSRSLIVNSVYGLVLVLSPVIIFSVINPNILSLNLNVAGLAVPTSQSSLSTGTPGTTSGTAATTPGNSLTQGGTQPAGGACSSNTNSCQNGLACNNQGKCATPNGNSSQSAGGDCSGNENACTTGLVCNNQGQCAAPTADGSQALNGDCSGNENACGTGLICNDGGVCISIPGDGTVAEGGSCLGNENACSSNSDTCNGDDICAADSTVDNTNTTVTCPDGSTADSAADCPDGASDEGN